MKDVEAESSVLRKRLREAEEDTRRVQQLFGESLEMRRELEQKVNDLKYDLVMARVGSPKSE